MNFFKIKVFYLGVITSLNSIRKSCELGFSSLHEISVNLSAIEGNFPECA